ncbi:MAG: outer membrane protein assembly factor [Saprospiraceae bacterium]|nr:outer membrane protein assembly factor [Saprospiraceae bacterium]
MIRFKLFHKTILFFLLAVLIACNPTRRLSNDQFLLTKNKIKGCPKEIDEDEVKSFIKQKPNRKILGVFRFHVGIYNAADRMDDKKEKKNRKTDKWKQRRIKKGKKIDPEKEERKRERSLKIYLQKIGEAPVILDTTLTEKSAQQIKYFLNSKGYFNSIVTDSCRPPRFIKKKRQVAIYNIQAGKPYKIRDIKYSINDSLIENYVNIFKDKSILVKDKKFDIDDIDKERDRISRSLRKLGFYYFSKDFIRFKIDSTLKSHQMDILIVINKNSHRLKEFPDSVVYENHKRYKINDILIYPDYYPLKSDSILHDTLIYNDDEKGQFYLLYLDKLMYKPKTLLRSITFKKGEYYNLENVEQTYKRFSDLANFKFIDIQFVNIASDTNTNENLLNCIIRLTRDYKQSYAIETEGTNSSGDLGVAGNLVFQNKNVFGGAEILNLKAKGAMEVQRIVGDDSQEDVINSSILPFNTFEAGVEGSLNIPGFLSPIKMEDLRKKYDFKTTVTTGYNYQKRPDYTRYIANLSFGYNWSTSKNSRHVFNPAEINSIKIFPSDTFNEKIKSYDQKIQNSYKDHLIMGGKYSWIFTNQKINKLSDFAYFRINGEFVGNFLYLANSLTNSQKDDAGSYTLFSIKYAQYLRSDFDFRYFNYFGQNKTLGFRCAFGMGIPYLNMEVLPFEKSFYVGGANGIRAWRIRDIGPGAFQDPNSTSFDKTGDIGLETSLELRFPIYKLLEGAAFIDAGNVWYKNKNSQFPGAEFQFDKFYKQMAIGWGLGARFDFSFFIIRTDFALRMHDPSEPEGERWIIKDSKIKYINFNFGIGYPF